MATIIHVECHHIKTVYVHIMLKFKVDCTLKVVAMKFTRECFVKFHIIAGVFLLRAVTWMDYKKKDKLSELVV